MTILSSLALFYGALLILVGISVLQQKSFADIYGDLFRCKGLLWLAGLFTFVMGLVSLLLYREWSGGVGSLVTLFGWLTLIKGAALTLAPNATTRLYKHTLGTSMLGLAGIVAVALGLLCFYLALQA